MSPYYIRVAMLVMHFVYILHMRPVKISIAVIPIPAKTLLLAIYLAMPANMRKPKFIVDMFRRIAGIIKVEQLKAFLK